MYRIFLSLLFLVILYHIYTTATHIESHMDPKAIFILYYAPWCGHSKNFLPAWNKFEEQNKGNPKVSIKKIDCDSSDVCDKKKIQGFPTCVLYKENKEIQYNGDRTVGSLNSFIKEHCK